jgi:hypothetical protein
MTAQGGGIWQAVLDDFPRRVGRPYMEEIRAANPFTYDNFV